MQSILHYAVQSWNRKCLVGGKDQMAIYSKRTGEEFWGSVELFENAPDAYQTINNLDIEPLGVHPDYQGKGLGSALEFSAYRVLKNHGARLINVDQVSLNEKAIAPSLKTVLRQINNASRYYADVK